jgi:hypothetical protein
MQLIEVLALQHFADSRIGSVTRKQRLKLPIGLAEQLESAGCVEILNPRRTVRTMPPASETTDAGGATLSVSSPQAQVSPQRIVSSLAQSPGDLSQSTTVTSEHHSQTFSTHVMEDGGRSITKKRGRPSKANSGLKMSGLQANTASIG